EEQLRVFVHVFMYRALSGGHAVHRLIAREMNDPTPALDVLVEQGLRPRIEYLSGVIAELIDCDVRDPRVLRCVASVQSQVVAYFPNPIAIRLGMRLAPTPAQIDAASRHLAAFSVARVQSQVVPSFPTPIAIRLGMRLAPTPAQIDAAARHIAAFSVAGVRAVG